jgi:hypothetical protein
MSVMPWADADESLKGVPPKDYARPALNAVMLGELIGCSGKKRSAAGTTSLFPA